MKSVVIVLLLAASAVAQEAIPAPGQGDWVNEGPGLWRGTSWHWRVTKNCYGCYSYQRLYPVVAVPVVGKPDFYELALQSLTKQQSETEQRQFLQQMFPGQALQTAGYSNGYTKTGVSVYQQGYVQGGSTLYGTASYNASNVDVNGIIHEAQRLADRVLGASEAAVAGAQDIVATAVDGNSKAAQITASAQVAAAAIQAANPPVQRVEATKTEPAPPPPIPRDQVDGMINRGELQPWTPPQPGATPPPPPGPHTGDSGSINQALWGRIALQQCTACHSGPAPKGSLDLSLAAIASLGPAERAELAGKVANRIDPAADPDKRMPKGKPALAQKMHDGLLAVLSH